MSSPSISIIVPVYKAESFLHQCIQSILNQTFKDFELILVNDGSPDNSGKVCDDFALKDERIKVIHKNNEGVSKARNTGIDASIGKYLMFCDADDFVEPTWCEEMINKVKDHSVVICGHYLNNQKANQNTISPVLLGNDGDYFSFKKKDIFPYYQKHFINSPWNKIFNAKMIKQNQIRFNESLSIGEDLLFNLDYLKLVDEDIIVVNKPLYHYVLRDTDSLTIKYHANQFDIYKQLFTEVYNCFKLFGVNLNEIKPVYFNLYLHALNHVFEHKFFKESKLSFFKKWKYNSMVLKSKEFTECLQNAQITDMNNLYVSLLKSQNYLLVYLYNYLRHVRNH
ncbi:glycosyltransferase family 2 protein [Bacillus marasmi]|uniref:glycosyltransferase family 2 protein n=1 Tax=Bacillus marasmi TaxID=1926279 RepID=UPI0011CC4431|nr:glycosyltransferase family 2 protein [Bacillus marasmi]